MSLASKVLIRRSGGFVPFQGIKKSPLLPRVAESTSEAPVAPSKLVSPLSWDEDKETARDVFAFAGSAPERANGRAAMVGFTSLALTEASKHTPALEQLGNSWAGIILVSLALSFATIVPKLVSGTSLKELHDNATSENLKSEGLAGQLIALFDQKFEMWSGRLAMIGIIGLVAVEAIKGDSFF